MNNPFQPYQADSTRYDAMQYRRAGKSGLKLPAVSLGLWHNFGGVDTLENARAHSSFQPLTGVPPLSSWESFHGSWRPPPPW